MVRVRVVISGVVQGVWFRDSCREEAESRGLTGWVRNNRDGTVEAAFEGTEVAVDEVVAWCRTGPPRAIVTGVEMVREHPHGDGRFRVL
ncbi:MAG: acylphosphatase [Actinobacteria bacterium]|nr:acylphosphatase [Actinomycetota bacterium]